MSAPTRWVDDGAELTEDERRALGAGMNVAVPHEAKDALWRSLGRRLPLAAAGAALGATATKSAAAISLVKMGVAGLVLGTVATVGIVGVERLLSPTTRPLPSAVRDGATGAHRVGPSPAREEPNVGLDPQPELPSPSAPPERPAATRKPPSNPVAEQPPPPAPERSVASFQEPVPAASDVDAGASLESRRVAEARSALRSGNARAALATLTTLRRDFPTGVLVQEREALIIEAVLALGDSAKARELATRFLARYPGSPHAAAAKRALE
jgi:hypothetical protein